jgi:hypothetical protein
VVLPKETFEWFRAYLIAKRKYEAMLFPSIITFDPEEEKKLKTARTLDWGGTTLALAA